MSWKAFDDDCPGCKPVIIDRRTMQPYPDESPVMYAMGRVWQGTTKKQREACHRVWCMKSQTAEDLAVMQYISEQFQLEMQKENPYTKPGCLKVEDVFKQRGAVCPFMAGGTFATVEDMMATFDKPEELWVVQYGPGCCAIAHKRDKDYIERKRKITDELIAKTGQPFGELSVEEVLWVKREVDRIMLESN